MAINVEHDIREFLVREFFYGKDERLKNDSSLLGGVIDSTGTISLVMFLQEHFQITVEDDEVIPENLDSVRKITVYVEKKLQREAHA